MPRNQLTTNSVNSVWDFMSEMERAFDDFWQPQTGTSLKTRELASFTPAVDLHENKDFYLVSVDVPGIPEKDIKIDVQKGRLTLSGERNREEHHDDGMFKRFERSYGRFERSFQLPKDVDEAKIQARTDNGVLEIMIPKAEVAKPRAIQIETEKGGLFSRLLGKKEVTSESGKEEKKH